MKVNVINSSGNKLPEYAKSGDSGMDLRADFSKGIDNNLVHLGEWDEIREVFLLYSGGRCVIPTGLYTSFPPGYEIQVRSRSGLAIKNGIFCLNSPGTIDANYRSEIGVILANFSDEVFEIRQGDRIAQAVLAKVSLIEWNIVDNLNETDRKGGFGHSGIK